MRALAIVALAGCFEPRLTAHLPCAQPDDWCPPPQTCGADGFCAGGPGGGGDAGPDAGLPSSNIAFTSSEPFVVGNRSNDVVLAAADEQCTRLGNKLRSGTYMAWLGISTMDAAMRIAGRVAPNAGWSRPDGKPFARSIQDVSSGTIYYPLRIDDDGADVVAVHGATSVLTALAASSCTTGANPKFGAADAEPPEMFDVNVGPTCFSPAFLYCFETDRTDAQQAPARDENLLYAFLLPSPVPLDTGMGMLDMACQHAGDSASLGRTFKAFLAPTGDPANKRFLPSTKAWTRMDGVVVAQPALDKFDAPLSLDPSTARLHALPVVGAPTPRDVGMDAINCSHWTSTAGSAPNGVSTRSDGSAFGAASFPCGTNGYLYCFETP